MFREIVRKKQALTADECTQILKTELRGVLSVIGDGGYREEGDWALNIKSVIVFGKIRAVKDFDRAMDICRKLSYKFTSDSEYIEKEIVSFGKNTLCLELIPEHITGKKIKES